MNINKGVLETGEGGGDCWHGGEGWGEKAENDLNNKIQKYLIKKIKRNVDSQTSHQTY